MAIHNPEVLIRKYLYLSIYTILLHISNGNTHVFRNQQFNETILNIVLCKLEMVTKKQELRMSVSRHLGCMTPTCITQ